VLDDTQTVHTDAPIGGVYAAVCSIGGERGWLVAEPLWELRGFADRVLGGPGMRRGRRHPSELRVGDSLDFFRVEALVPERLVRLRAEMKVPGEAWLEWTMDPEPGGTRLVQKARFHPRGVWGRAYWYAMLPFHDLIFRRLAATLAGSSGGQPDGQARPEPEADNRCSVARDSLRNAPRITPSRGGRRFRPGA
jgi:hypothetical protein